MNSRYKGDPAAEGIAAAREDDLHRNLISDEEDARTEGCLVDFEIALDKLLADAAREADDIGGYFRGPGIRASLKRIYIARTNRRWLNEEDK